MKNFSLLGFILDKIRVKVFLKKLNCKSLDLTFSKLSKKLDNLKKEVDSFIKILNKYELFLSNHEFNMIFFIFFHSDIFLTKKNELSTKLQKSVKYIMKIFLSYNIYEQTCLFKIYISISSYLKLLKEWIPQDKENLVKDLASDYINADNLLISYQNYKYLNYEEKDNILYLKKYQHNILKKLLDLNGSDIIKKINPMDLKIDTYSSNLSLIVEELKEIPINFKSIKSIFIEIKSLIYLILDKRLDILLEFESCLNINSFKNDSYYLLSNTNKLFDLLFKLQSSKYDKLTEKYHKDLKQSMINGAQLYQFLPRILYFLLDSYHIILNEKNLICNKKYIKN